MTTRDEILVMARECGDWSGQTVEMNEVGLERFYRLAQAAAYERAAAACDAIAEDRWDRYKGRGEYQGQGNPYRACDVTQGESLGAEACAEGIRALKEGK